MSTAGTAPANDALMTPCEQQDAEVTPDAFRDAMRSFVTGVTVVTVAGRDGPYGATVNAFSSLSLQPPLVLVCLASTSRSGRELERAGAFAVNVLACHQGQLARWFAAKDRPRGGMSFVGVPHRTGLSGAPLLDGCAAQLDCELVDSLRAGDHTAYVGAVLAVAAERDAEPLVFHRGRFVDLDRAVGLADGGADSGGPARLRRASA